MANSTSIVRSYCVAPGFRRLSVDPHNGHLAPGSGGHHSHPSLLGLDFAELMEAGGAEPLNAGPLARSLRLDLSVVFPGKFVVGVI